MNTYRPLACPHPHTSTPSLAFTHSWTHMNTHMHLAHTQCTFTQVHTHKCTHPHDHTPTQTQTHTHPHPCSWARSGGPPDVEAAMSGAVPSAPLSLCSMAPMAPACPGAASNVLLVADGGLCQHPGLNCRFCGHNGPVPATAVQHFLPSRWSRAL